VSHTQRRCKAGHGCELPFVFGRLGSDDVCGGYWQRFLGAANADLPELQQLSDEMMASWAEFAKSGTPGSVGGKPFPLFPNGRLQIGCALGLPTANAAAAAAVAPSMAPLLLKLWGEPHGIKQFCMKQIPGLEDPFPGVEYDVSV
jgi:hypothetical protein